MKVEPAPSLLVKCELPKFSEKPLVVKKFVEQTAIYVGRSEKCNAQLDGLIDFHKSG